MDRPRRNSDPVLYQPESGEIHTPRAIEAPSSPVSEHDTRSDNNSDSEVQLNIRTSEQRAADNHVKDSAAKEVFKPPVDVLPEPNNKMAEASCRNVQLTAPMSLDIPTIYHAKDVRSWVRRTRRILSIYELPREVARLLVEESFQGSMRKWYDSLPDKLTEDIGWENMVDHAVSDLQEEPPLWKDARPLYEITQGISTVKEFMGALREKARDIQLNDDVLLMGPFVAGLNTRIQEAVVREEPKDLLHAVRRAGVAEKTATAVRKLRELGSVNKPPSADEAYVRPVMSASHDMEPPSGAAFQDMCQRMDTYMKKILEGRAVQVQLERSKGSTDTSRKRNQSMWQNSCVICKTNKHSSWDCALLPYGPRQDPTGRGKCWICGHEDHRATKCPRTEATNIQRGTSHHLNC